jgi:predicted nucleic acid-binding protein
MFVVVDASVWVARLVPEDTFYQTVKAWMSAQRTVKSELLSPSLLLAEIGGAISRRTEQPLLGLRAVEVVQTMPGVRLVELDSTLMSEAARLAAELGLRGADSVYAAIASRLDLPLATLDVDQREKAGQRVSIMEVA